MRSVNGAFDTGAGPNLLRENMLKPNWISSVHAGEKPRLRNAMNQKIEVVRTIILHDRMGEPLVRVVFRTVWNFAVSVLLGTSLIERL